jgi:hypothetical protein
VYKKEDGIKSDIGCVTTSLTATNEIAWDKAAHKYILGRPYTMGWSMHVKKESIVEVGK